ncbi:cupin domain-containing protein [Pedobacter arcticus]|uniref:cupin domain-containing protein n=1 Tax=Pedobacter arcticus TaxID=752140 RepID=UPI000474AE52|nr:cupin domain-containing protein [Pedobacter arcticus]
MKIISIAVLMFMCTLTVFAQDDNHTDKIQVTKLAESTRSWNGDQLPPYSTGQPKVTILKITIPVHAKLDLHKHLAINAGILTKGVLTVRDDKGNVLELTAGDTIIELVNTYHYGENKGSEPAEIIVFYAGTEGKAITVKK